MCVSAIFLKYINHSEDIRSNKPLSTFPTEVGEWRGEVNYFKDKIYRVLGVDDSVLINYQNEQGRVLQLYVGFYQSQREGDLIHSPKNCMPGGGWNIVDMSVHEISIPEMGDQNFKLVKLKLKNGPAEQLVLYWYQSRGRIIHSEYLQKIYLVMDSITKKRTDGSFVRLLTPVKNNDEELSFNDLEGFAKSILPILMNYIPS